jgi:hypothetical protein
MLPARKRTSPCEMDSSASAHDYLYDKQPVRPVTNSLVARIGESPRISFQTNPPVGGPYGLRVGSNARQWNSNEASR